MLAVSNPMRIVETAALLPYWGDLHGQSEETIGTASALHYFHFARDRAFLDVVGHQGNDFQITRGFYDDAERADARIRQSRAFRHIARLRMVGQYRARRRPQRLFRRGERAQSTVPRTPSSPIRRISTPIAPRRPSCFAGSKATTPSSTRMSAAVTPMSGSPMTAGSSARWKFIPPGAPSSGCSTTRSIWATASVSLQQRRPQGAPGRELSRRLDLWRLWRPDLPAVARADAGGGDRLPAPAPSLRHHRQSHGARRARPFRPPGGTLRRGPGAGPDLVAPGARGDDGRHPATAPTAR